MNYLERNLGNKICDISSVSRPRVKALSGNVANASSHKNGDVKGHKRPRRDNLNALQREKCSQNRNEAKCGVSLK